MDLILLLKDCNHDNHRNPKNRSIYIYIIIYICCEVLSMHNLRRTHSMFHADFAYIPVCLGAWTSIEVQIAIEQGT